MNLKHLLLIAPLLFVATCPALASTADEAPEPEFAVSVSAARVDRNVINLTFRPYPGVKVYADSVAAQIAGGPFLHDGFVAPTPNHTTVENGRTRGLYTSTTKFTLVRADLVSTPTINVRYQACYKQTLCYPPRTVSLYVPPSP